GEQLLARLVVREPTLVLHHPALVVHAAVLDPEHAHVAFAVERNRLRMQRVLRIRTHAIERAVQVRRNLARDLTVADVGLELVERLRPTHLGRNVRARGRAELAALSRRLRPSAAREHRADPGGCADRSGHERATIDVKFVVGHGRSPTVCGCRAVKLNWAAGVAQAFGKYRALYPGHRSLWRRPGDRRAGHRVRIVE